MEASHDWRLQLISLGERTTGRGFADTPSESKSLPSEVAEIVPPMSRPSEAPVTKALAWSEGFNEDANYALLLKRMF